MALGLPTLLSAAFTGMKTGGGILKALSHQKGAFDPLKRIEDPYTTQANKENQQQKQLLGNMYQQNLGTANRSAANIVSNAQNQAIGASGQMGLGGAGATARALAGLTSGNMGDSLLTNAGNATAQYTEGMAQTNDFTKRLADDVMYQTGQGGNDRMSSFGGLLQNLPQTILSSNTQALGATESGITPGTELMRKASKAQSAAQYARRGG